MIISFLLFLALTLPFLGAVPYLDGNIDFIKTIDFYEGGLKQLFQNWNSVHPPLKAAMLHPIYKTLGINTFTYILPGIVFGLLGILYINLLTKKLFNKKVGLLAGILFATSPIFISVGIFSLIDFLLTVFIAVALYYYLSGKVVVATIFTTLAVLTKETGLVFATVVLISELMFLTLHFFRKKSLLPEIFKTAIALTPFAASYLWFLLIKVNGQGMWSDWNFSEVSDKGTLFTIYHNLISLNLFNNYAYQNWAILFFLNFNWIYWLIFTLGIVVFFKKKGFKEAVKKILVINSRNKIFVTSSVFCLVYTLSVLSFQTYTIPRYSLPVLLFLIIGTSWALNEVERQFKNFGKFLKVFLFAIIFLSLFWSMDPISKKIWGENKVLGENLYALNKSLAGSDGITYNAQYLLILSRRSEIIKDGKASKESKKGYDCWWLFPDIHNDRKTITALSLNSNILISCGLSY